MRWEVTKKFDESIHPFLEGIRNVAVVGGSSKEPELAILQNTTELKLEIFGIQPEIWETSRFHYIDLNYPLLENHKKFDLILCSQVLEHLWDVKQALVNLTQLAAPGGLIWIGCPASNFPHGLPGYFSAGYQPELILNILNLQRIEVIAQGVLGSKRYYFLTHALQSWATKRQFHRPLFYGFSRYYPFQIFDRLSATLKSPKTSNQQKFATETFVLVRVLD